MRPKPESPVQPWAHTAPGNSPALLAGDFAFGSVGTRAVRLAPYLLALVFVLWSLRGVPGNTVVDPDSARHAMNGAFIRDWLIDGRLRSPGQFGLEYYGRLPALSLPFHPPLFPAVEAFFFLVLGVNLLSARLVVALSVGLCAVLLYRLAGATHGSRALAAAATLTFLFLPVTQTLSADVMLEMPSMVFVLAAIYCLRSMERGYPLRSGLWFALLAGAAVWTKQHSIFLAIVPFIYIAAGRRWNLLSRKTLWISSFVLLALVLALFALPLWVPLEKNKPSPWLPRLDLSTLAGGLVYYSRALANQFGMVGLPALCFGFAGALCCRAREETARLGANAVYLAWALAAALMLVCLPLLDGRYAVYLYAPVIVIACDGLLRLGSRWLGARAAVWILAPLTLAVVASSLRQSAPFLHGPQEAARMAAAGPNRRVLYCGRSNGAFIFSVRTCDSSGEVRVLRGDKLPAPLFRREQFENFVRTYGIGMVVLEKTAKRQPWDDLIANPTASMAPGRVIPQTSSRREIAGNLHTYRVNAPPATSNDPLKIRLGLDWRTGLELKF